MNVQLDRYKKLSSLRNLKLEKTSSFKSAKPSFLKMLNKLFQLFDFLYMYFGQSVEKTA